MGKGSNPGATVVPEETGARATTFADVAVEPPGVPPRADEAWPCNDAGSWPINASTPLPEAPDEDVPPSCTVPPIGARTTSPSTVCCAIATAARVCTRCAAPSDASAAPMLPTPDSMLRNAATDWMRALAYCACAVAIVASACADV